MSFDRVGQVLAVASNCFDATQILNNRIKPIAELNLKGTVQD